jgi:acyl-CoA reductase-like NAD-dependent aldehyde dehydrogenase
MSRLDVRKTHKLYIGGSFPRSESGRVYPVADADGGFVANVARASRKDVRDAVVAARKALGGWSGATAYNRGQILYRVAEMLEGRREQFVAELVATLGSSRREAQTEVDATIDRWVWYAGWTDKFPQIDGGANPVAGPYFNFSLPEPTGVVGIVAPGDAPLLGLVSVIGPVVAGGNTCVVVTSGVHPTPAVALSEVLATSDVPGGVVNLLTGHTDELAPHLAAHMDVNAIDLCGIDDPEQAAELERVAADNLKRVVRPAGEALDWTATPDPTRILAFTETKTVWHPMGL